MTDKEYTHVTINEFITFSKQYPAKLHRDVTGICEPAMLSLNDFNLGDWPDSMVARAWLSLNGDFENQEVKTCSLQYCKDGAE